MSLVIREAGDYSFTQCTAKCDACGTVALGVQHTGPHGYSNVCAKCMQDSFATYQRLLAAPAMQVKPILLLDVTLTHLDVERGRRGVAAIPVEVCLAFEKVRPVPTRGLRVRVEAVDTTELEKIQQDGS